MFVRWKRRQRDLVYTDVDYYTRKWISRRETGWTNYAVVCKSERVNGKPVQKFVAHLGHIQDDEISNENIVYNFWEQVNYRLDCLQAAYSLDESAILALKNSIERVVPVLPDETIASIEQAREKSKEMAMAMLRSL